MQAAPPCLITHNSNMAAKFAASGASSGLDRTFADGLPLIAGEVGGDGDAELYVHGLIDDVCGHPSPHDDTGASERAVRCADAWRAFLSNAAGYDLTPEQVREDLERAGLPAAVVATAGAAVEARRDEIVQALVRHASTIAPQYLRDFDWSVRLVLSSDKLSGMRESRLLLRLQLDAGAADDGQGDRDVRMEMNADELDRLLEQFAEIEREVSELKQN